MASGGYNKERALAKAANIYNILLQVFALAKERDILPYEAANALAEERIAQALAKGERVDTHMANKAGVLDTDRDYQGLYRGKE